MLRPAIWLMALALVVGSFASGDGCYGNTYFTANGKSLPVSRIGDQQSCNPCYCRQTSTPTSSTKMTSRSCKVKAVGSGNCVNEHFRSPDVASRGQCGRCVSCAHSSSDLCPSGTKRTKPATDCTGKEWTRDRSEPAECAACGNSVNGRYVCPFGYRKTGSQCGGGEYDTQACEVCGNGGTAYTCGPTEYKSGAPCDGTTTSNTQTCAACVMSACDPGYRIATPCEETPDRIAVCEPCENGNTTYTCKNLEYKSGTACPGNTTTDTQTCKHCVPEPCALAQILANFTYNSTTETATPATACDGAGYEDTMTCVDCDVFGNYTTCPENTFKVNSSTTCSTGISCIGCNNTVNGTYTCPDGETKSGKPCNDTTTDTQTCEPIVIPPPPVPLKYDSIETTDLTCIELAELLLPLDLTSRDEYLIQRVVTIEENGTQTKTYLYTVKSILTKMRTEDCLYQFANGLLK